MNRDVDDKEIAKQDFQHYEAWCEYIRQNLLCRPKGFISTYGNRIGECPPEERPSRVTIISKSASLSPVCAYSCCCSYFAPC
jgi:hypothetical protein